MKKILGIIVLSLLLSTNVYAAKQCLRVDGSFGPCKESWTNKIPGISYFKKRSKCQAQADTRNTVAIGKKIFKQCMNK